MHSVHDISLLYTMINYERGKVAAGQSYFRTFRPWKVSISSQKPPWPKHLELYM